MLTVNLAVCIKKKKSKTAEDSGFNYKMLGTIKMWGGVPVQSGLCFCQRILALVKQIKKNQKTKKQIKVKEQIHSLNSTFILKLNQMFYSILLHVTCHKHKNKINNKTVVDWWGLKYHGNITHWVCGAELFSVNEMKGFLFHSRQGTLK